MSQLRTLGDPASMRPSIRRHDFGHADPIGEHQLADGRVAWVTWLHHTGQNCHVVVWVPGSTDFATVENVNRRNAGRVSEKLMREFGGES